VLAAYYGPDITDESLRGTVAFVIDSSRESPVLPERLRHLRHLAGSGINHQLGDLLAAAGYAELDAALAAAVLDGSILVSTAEKEPDIAGRAIRDLTAVLEMAARNGRR